MKKLVLLLVSVLSFSAGAQPVLSDGLMLCINEEFRGMAQQTVESLFVEEARAEMAKATTPQEQQAIAQQFEALMDEALVAMVEPYSTLTADANGQLVINVTDVDIIAAYTPICNTLGDIAASGTPKLDTQSPIYEILLKERKELEVKIQPQMDEISEIEKTIAELTQKIADIQNGISTELDKINEIDTFVQEKLTVPAKPAEQVGAELAEALQSPEVMAMMAELSAVLGEKFSESAGEEITINLGGSPAPAPQPAPTAPAVDQPVSGGFIPDFKN